MSANCHFKKILYGICKSVLREAAKCALYCIYFLKLKLIESSTVQEKYKLCPQKSRDFIFITKIFYLCLCSRDRKEKNVVGIFFNNLTHDIEYIFGIPV